MLRESRFFEVTLFAILADKVNARSAAALIVWAGLTAPVLVAAAAPEVNLGYFNKLAMNGYDIMTYWKGGDPEEGVVGISMEYNVATWIFVSEENRALFAQNPGYFAPRYGDYCAYAASQNAVADVDPFAWRIWKDKLYLNYNPHVRRM